jgi:GDP-D-mannose dehydratase
VKILSYTRPLSRLWSGSNDHLFLGDKDTARYKDYLEDLVESMRVMLLLGASLN